jgi:hypothetical protein
VEPPGCLLDPRPQTPHRRIQHASTTCAACTNGVRRYLLPRLEILPRIVRSPAGSLMRTDALDISGAGATFPYPI